MYTKVIIKADSEKINDIVDYCENNNLKYALPEDDESEHLESERFNHLLNLLEFLLNCNIKVVRAKSEHVDINGEPILKGETYYGFYEVAFSGYVEKLSKNSMEKLLSLIFNSNNDMEMFVEEMRKFVNSLFYELLIKRKINIHGNPHYARELYGQYFD